MGRVPLYLLDTDLPQNSQVGRWVTSRLYESSRAIRLAQYAVPGVGGVRALHALGIKPAVYHLNEGHPALGVFELLTRAQSDGAAGDPWQRVREQLVFTTHTPVPAGNENYQRNEVLAVLGRIADLAGDREHFLAMGRVEPTNPNQSMGMTALALRARRHANGVSRRHGHVARAIGFDPGPLHGCCGGTGTYLFCYRSCRTCADFVWHRSYHEFFKEITWLYHLISSTSANLSQYLHARVSMHKTLVVLGLRAVQTRNR